MRLPLAAALILAGLPAAADPPVIEAATAQPGPRGWRIDVTLRHPDTGWPHFADAWQVLGPDGTVLGTRKLVHPHVTEQPFTRSLTGVSIPEDVTDLTIRARCNRDGWVGQPYTLTLSR